MPSIFVCSIFSHAFSCRAIVMVRHFHVLYVQSPRGNVEGLMSFACLRIGSVRRQRCRWSYCSSSDDREADAGTRRCRSGRRAPRWPCGRNTADTFAADRHSALPAGRSLVRSCRAPARPVFATVRCSASPDSYSRQLTQVTPDLDAFSYTEKIHARSTVAI